MSRRTESIGPEYFNDMYAADPDPWRFASSHYEREKYAASLAALPQRRFASALEVGCSIGIFTAALAARCDWLVALDVADAALARARENCAEAHVSFANLRVPGQWPPGRFDLIVLSEVLYYLDQADLARVAGQARGAVQPGGCILLVHFLGETNYPLSGDAAAERFMLEAGLPRLRQQRAPLYRIDVLGVDQPLDANPG